MLLDDFPFQKQYDSMDCGPACLFMVCRHYRLPVSVRMLRERMIMAKDGVSLLSIAQTAEAIGFQSMVVKAPMEELDARNIPLPAVLLWGGNHFVVLYKIRKDRFYIADPAQGLVQYARQEFMRHWATEDEGSAGFALLLDKGEGDFGALEKEMKEERKKDKSIWSYLLPHRRILFQVLLGTLLGTFFQLLFPFISQSLVDVGINNSNIHFIYICLASQLALYVGQASVEFVKSWLLLYLNNRINITILTTYFVKLMRLPIPYFDSKNTGDVLQRINDHQRIQNFLTGGTFNTIFSFFNLILYSVVLAVFNLKIFFVFLAASIVYIVWVIVFLAPRRRLDNRYFRASAEVQNNTIEMLNGMHEIKMNVVETPRRWQWERAQARLLGLGFKELYLNQVQYSGSMLINEGKNIFITFLAAMEVVNGSITFGTMLAIQYIIGILSRPVEQATGFVQQWQESKLSLGRLNEVHGMKDEEPEDAGLNRVMPDNKTIRIAGLHFSYPGESFNEVLSDIHLTIPQGGVTAIVGVSGSGKTTLLKLLLKFYEPSGGEIWLGDGLLKNFSHGAWRSRCGVVLQDSYIFSDSIINNIAVGDEQVDFSRLNHAMDMANIREFIQSLPKGYHTQIGAMGVGLSMGQRQRILIARAIYKDPEFIFFDEATNSLDANNESVILENLNQFFRNRTVVIVAHRLSTVRFADQIVVLNKGRIIEQGTHEELAGQRGAYFQLVKNQLELGE